MFRVALGARRVYHFPRARHFSTSQGPQSAPKRKPAIFKVFVINTSIALAASHIYLNYFWKPRAVPEVPDSTRPWARTRLRQAYPFEFPAPPSPEEATNILNHEAYSRSKLPVQGVQRYDGVRVQSNSPTEDSFLHGPCTSPWSENKKWLAWGVFDGHAGAQVANLLTRYLLHYVTQELIKVAPNVKAQDPNSATPIIDHAIKKAFVTLDDDMMCAATTAVLNEESFATKVSQLIPGYAGSCALLSLFDPESRLLRVACTGDSRAVLGQKSSDGSWQTIALSIDQHGENPDELARLQREHPDEPNMVKGKRLLGLAVTRAFGDGRWKWDQETQEVARQKYNGPKVRPDFKTPPYLTAEPVIATKEIEMDKPSFLIMASDGLWDHMSSEQAVMLVGKWLDWTVAGRPSPTPLTTTFDNFNLSLFEDADWQVNEKTVTTQDENAAVHLARNALGGANPHILSGVLAFQPPLSRNVRDDITVQVIFFGDSKTYPKL